MSKLTYKEWVDINSILFCAKLCAERGDKGFKNIKDDIYRAIESLKKVLPKHP